MMSVEQRYDAWKIRIKNPGHYDWRFKLSDEYAHSYSHIGNNDDTKIYSSSKAFFAAYFDTYDKILSNFNEKDRKFFHENYKYAYTVEHLTGEHFYCKEFAITDVRNDTVGDVLSQLKF